MTRSDGRPAARRRLGVGALLAGALLLVVTLPATASNGQEDLREVRRATAKYHDLDTAIADGYELGYARGDGRIITGCITNPAAGSMGYHWFNRDLIDDPATDPLRPEGLLYAPGPNGQLRLVAVEWVVPSEVWATTGSEDPPSVLGTDLHILNPALGWYIHHAWVWLPNPSGMFSDWNPRVDCPDGVAPPTS